GALVPMVLTVLGGLGWAFGNIGSRLAAQHPPARPAPDVRLDNALRMTLWMSVVPPIPFAVMSLVFDGPTAGVESLTTLGSPGGLLALAGLAYTVLLGTVAGSGLWVYLMSRHPASSVAPLSLLVPIVGITAAWLLLGERPTVIELIGAVTVIVGCAAGVLAAPRSRPKPATQSGSAHGVRQRRTDPVDGGTRVRADQRHVREGVDEAAGAVEGHRDTGLLESVGVRDALIAQRIEAGDDDVRRCESGEVVGQQR
ncbi:MAG: EamA family transporter, partial [Actinomycetota bacterium]|nr:EamA family transporter [Actinomycetota bacterium]